MRCRGHRLRNLYGRRQLKANNIFCFELFFRKCYTTVLSILITNLIWRHTLLKSNEKTLYKITENRSLFFCIIHVLQITQRLYIMWLHRSGNTNFRNAVATKLSSLKYEPTNLTLPDSNRSEWFFWTFLIDQSTSSGMWSIPTTWPCSPTYKTSSLFCFIWDCTTIWATAIILISKCLATCSKSYKKLLIQMYNPFHQSNHLL